jgi:taurine transport system permease protein
MTTAESTPGVLPAGAIRPNNRRGPVGSGRSRQWGIRLAALAAVIAVWFLITAIKLVDPLYLPSPSSVWHAFVTANTDHPVSKGSSRIVRGEQNYFLWEHLVASLQRIAIGVGAAIVVAVPLGLLMATVHWLGVMIEPYLSFLRSLPPLGYLGLLIVWFGIGDTSKIWLLFLAAFPPIAMATISGVQGVREDQVNAVLTLGASRRQVLTSVMVPATLPEIINGIRVATGFAWTCVVAAELNNGLPGIGGLAYVSGTQLKTPLVIACIVVIGVAAVLLDTLLKALERVLVPWRGRV